jgi:hemerythrin
MNREVVAQHRRLDALFAETRAALRQGAPGAGDCFATLANLLEAHFIQEDELYYPAIRALRPERKVALLEFTGAHRRFRELLRQIEGRLRAGSVEEAAEILEELAAAFASHEVSEEKQLHSLDRELAQLES